MAYLLLTAAIWGALMLYATMVEHREAAERLQRRLDENDSQ